MISLPVFPFKDAQAFYDNLVASQPDPNTRKPDPAKMAAFAASHPETVRVIGYLKTHPSSSGFVNSTFFGLNAFRLTDANGTSIPVRWQLVPVQPFEAAVVNSETQDKSFLFDALIASILQHPLQWRLVITVGQPGDPTNDPPSSGRRGGNRWTWEP